MKFSRMIFFLLMLLPAFVFAGETYYVYWKRGNTHLKEAHAEYNRYLAATQKRDIFAYGNKSMVSFGNARANFQAALGHTKNKKGKVDEEKERECNNNIAECNLYFAHLEPVVLNTGWQLKIEDKWADIFKIVDESINQASDISLKISDFEGDERKAKISEIASKIDTAVAKIDEMITIFNQTGDAAFQANNAEFLDNRRTEKETFINWLRQLKDRYSAEEKSDHSEKEAEKAFSLEYGFSFKLTNENEVITQLNLASDLYASAAEGFRQASRIVSSHLEFKNLKDLYDSKAIKNRQASEKCRALAQKWPEEIKAQKKAFEEKLAALEKEITSDRKSLQLMKLKLNVLKELSIYSPGRENEIALLETTIGETEANLNDNSHIDEPNESAARDEKKLRELFFKHLAFTIPDYDKFLLVYLSTQVDLSTNYVFPLDGQREDASKSFILQKDQFYRFLIRGPLKDALTVRVFEEGEEVYEEQISWPSKNTLSWDNYLTDKGHVIIPNTKLRDDFGLDLQVRIITHADHSNSVLFSQRSSSSMYRFSVSANEELYSFSFIDPVPWQLEEMRKPALSVSHKPIKKPSLTIQLDPKLLKNLDSPELETHPILDKFVQEMKRDPIGLAQYVQNEIEFVDTFLNLEGGVFKAAPIHRSALGTFLEKQGSAWEQCALLIYLLRKAGYTAVYAESEPYLLPKEYAERLIGTQFVAEEEVLFQYPWVLFYDGKEWVSLFPWLKDIQTHIGYELYSRLPEDYASPELWIKKYLTNDERILKYVGNDGDDTAGVLFIRFLEDELRKQGLSIHDVGIHRKVIKKQYHAWSDFPRCSISGEFKIHLSLIEKNDLFAQVHVNISSKENPQKSSSILIPTFTTDFNSFKIYFEPIDEVNHKMHFFNTNLVLTPEDKNIELTVTYSLSKLKHTFEFAKGTSAVLCFNLGGEAPKKTAYLAEKFDNSPEKEKIHSLLSFIGAAYFEKCNRSEKRLAALHKINPSTILRFGLAKLSPDVSKGAVIGWPILEFPQVDMINFAHPSKGHPLSWHGENTLSNKQVTALLCVDYSSNEHQILREIFDDKHAISTVKLLQIAHQEHKNKGLPGTGFLVLTKMSFLDADQMPEMTQSFYFSHLANLKLRDLKKWALGQWDMARKYLVEKNEDASSYVYMTPYPISSQDGHLPFTSSYTGMGTLIFNRSATFSLISDNLGTMNGGYGTRLKPDFFEPAKLKDMKLQVKNDRLTENTKFSYDLYSTKQRYQLSNFDSLKKPLDIKPIVFTGPRLPPGWRAEVRQEYKSIWDSVCDPVDVVTGAFYADEVDLSLAGPFPLEVRRNYNNQNPHPSILGYGWKLSLNPELHEEGDKIFAAEEDGTVIVYRYSPEASKWIVLAEDNPELRNYNKKGIGSSANPYHSYITKDVGYIHHGTDGSKRVYENLKLKSCTDHLGNKLTFSYFGEYLSRIDSSNGGFIGFCYNHDHRICEAYSKDGRRVYYNYNVNGDLTEVILPNGAQITYEYDQEHRLVREIRPLGRVLENVYDEQSRVIEQKAPVGPYQAIVPNAFFSYSDGQTLVKDASGATTEYKIYKNQIYKIIDPQGNEILQSWYLDNDTWFDAESESVRPVTEAGAYPRSLKSSKDKRGLVTHYKYDNKGNPEVITLQGEDLTGDGVTQVEKTFVYNANNLCIKEVVLNNVSVNHYDERFPFALKRKEKFCDEVLTSYVDFERDRKGQVCRQDSSGAVTLYEYDNRGFPITQTQITNTEDPDVVTQYQFNNQGQLVEQISTTGIVYNDYDIMGNKIQTTVFDLSRTPLATTYSEYNLNNQIIWQQGADCNDIVYFDYNAAGLLKSTRRLLTGLKPGSTEVTPIGYAFNLFDYDTRGNLILEVDALGHSTYKEYDSLGRVITLTKGDLTERFEYEPGGLLARHYAPNGAVTYRHYTTNGLVKSEVDAERAEKSWIYDHFGRVVEERQNGCTWKTIYDDAAQKIVRVQLETNISEAQLLDSRGNVVGTIDAEGYLRQKTYDGLNRVVREVSPNGDAKLWHYQNNIILCALPNGEKILQLYQIDNLIENLTFNSKGNCVSHIIYKNYFDQSINQEINCDIVTTTWTSTQGLPLAVQTGNLLTTFAYDPCGNKTSVTDGEGNTTNYEYDALGRLTKKTLPDSTVIEYEYDKGSNLIAAHMPGGITWKASYDLMGRKCSEEVTAEGKTDQARTYHYVEGRLDQSKDPLGRILKYSYDPAGRLVQESIGKQTRNYTYDQRGLLLSAEEIGDETSLIKRAYDECGRLTSEEIYLGSKLLQHTQQSWRPTGRTLEIEGHLRDFCYEGGRLKTINADGIELSYEYDLSGFMKSKKTPFATFESEKGTQGLPIRRFTNIGPNPYEEKMDWDACGKMTSYQANWPKLSNTRSFKYNSRGQLIKADKDDYEFDFGKKGIGLRTSSPEWQIPSNGVDVFARPVLEVIDKKKINAQYDPMGQLVSRTVPGILWNPNLEEYKWDDWGRLVKSTKDGCEVKAFYDAFGRRIKTIQTVNGKAVENISFFDPEEEFQEMGVKIGDKIFWKIFADDTCEAILDEKGNAAVLIHDVLRNLVAVATSEEVLWNNELPNPYGVIKNKPALDDTLVSFAQSHKWQSLRADATGLMWMGARHYDPRSGSFLSPDPVSYPLSLNLYSYADGDPINNSDLDGRFSSSVYATTRSTVVGAWNDTRFQGLLGAADGAFRIAAGAAVAGGTGGLGAAVGCAIGAQGLDSLYTGIRQMYTGEEQTKAFVQALEGAGLSREHSEMVDTCLSMALDYKQAAVKATRLVSASGSTLCKTSTTTAKSYKPFTKNNYRHNLEVRTGISPPGNIHAHHVIPQKFRDRLAEKGFNVDHPDRLTWWGKGHQKNAKKYNEKWDEFFWRNPNAKEAEILDFGRNIMAEYNFNVNF